MRCWIGPRDVQTPVTGKRCGGDSGSSTCPSNHTASGSRHAPLISISYHSHLSPDEGVAFRLGTPCLPRGQNLFVTTEETERNFAAKARPCQPGAVWLATIHFSASLRRSRPTTTLRRLGCTIQRQHVKRACHGTRGRRPTDRVAYNGGRATCTCFMQAKSVEDKL